MNIPAPDFLNTIIKTSIVNLKESVFKTKYISLLFHEDPMQFNTAWINEVSNSVSVSVQVTDELNNPLYLDDEKTLPFIIPPLKQVKIHANKKLNDTLRDAEHQLNNSFNFTKNHFDALFPHLIKFSDEQSEEHIKIWNLILARYDLSNRIKDSSIVENKNLATYVEEEW